jgi:hypothetical protein
MYALRFLPTFAPCTRRCPVSHEFHIHAAQCTPSGHGHPVAGDWVRERRRGRSKDIRDRDREHEETLWGEAQVRGCESSRSRHRLLKELQSGASMNRKNPMTDWENRSMATLERSMEVPRLGARAVWGEGSRVAYTRKCSWKGQNLVTRPRISSSSLDRRQALNRPLLEQRIKNV